MKMKRTIEQIRAQYEVEKELASKLKQALKEERTTFYASLYNELYERVPQHPQLTRKINHLESNESVSAQLVLVRRFVKRNTVFAEIGPGDCALSSALTQMVSQVYAIDVSTAITNNNNRWPQNFQLILSDGKSIPLPPDSVNVVYSNQLMEHLHPDDAFEQLINVFNVLSDGGKYICITPNRINGPHDISKYFDKIATGFHLKEYTFSELRKMFKKVGFKTISGYWGAKGVYIPIHPYFIIFFERLIHLLPRSVRKNRLTNIFLYIIIVGTK